jgi:UDP-N-acetylmuramyl pentapeptide phosphotransferase/UDP-N-acetylglucosamine-1-phosphate transferase
MRVYLITDPYLLQAIFTLIVIGLLSKTALWFGADSEFGIQKNHFNSVSRLGGLGIGLSIFSGIYFINSFYPSESYLSVFLMVAFMPIFIGGLVEDITHKVSPFFRLTLASVSSLAVVFVTRVQISYTDISLLDSILKIPFISLLLTILLIVGFLNSVNIIDGFNGLASGATLIMLISFGIITLIVDDFILFRILFLAI